MKKLKYITFVLIGVLAFSACEVDYLSDPNQPEVAPTYGIMNRVQKRLLDDTRDEWYSGRQMLLWVQYWNQTNYTEEDRFQYRETSNQSAWDDLYGNAQDLVDLINFNVDESTKGSMLAYGPNEAQIAAAQVMLVYIYQTAAELWGDVPYYSYGSSDVSFQANHLKDGISSPVYATQEAIYADMLNVLASAQATFATVDYVIDGDNFFAGDPVQWRMFANSMRLRIANRVKDVLPAAAAHITGAIADGVMESNADNAGFKYENNAENGSPMYRAFVVNARHDFAPSYSFVELLKGNRGPFSADPRLAAYVEPNADGQYLGVPLTENNLEVGLFEWESDPTHDIIYTADATLYYMEYSEVCFLMSETLGWDQTWYEAGVRASMVKWGVAAADITAYISGLPAASMETVMMQKYIALYMQPMEAWSEYRRTGYPNTLIKAGETYDYSWTYTNGGGASVDTTSTYFYDVIGGLTDMPTRNMYLLNEASINGANVDAATSSNGGDAQDTKLWWQE